LCIPFLTDCCGISLDTLRAHLRLERIKVFTESDRGFTGDYRYDPPVGWCCIPIIPIRNTSEGKWDYCYHGTRPRFVRSILKDQLVVPGNRTSEGVMVEIQPGHIPNEKYIFTSPSVHYAAHFVYAQPVEWRYEGKTYYVRTVFQVRQKHDTYHIRRNTLHESCWDPTVSFDDHFKNEELEWYTNDKSTIVLAGLLLHFSDVPVVRLIRERQEERRRHGRSETSLANDREKFQINLKDKKGKILWIDDHPDNNKNLTRIIRDNGVECIECLDTEDGIRELRANRSEIYCIITDLVRTERRSGDSRSKDYYKAGIDFIREAKRIGVTQPIYMYSGWCRSHRDLIEESLEAGATKVCTFEEVEYIIRK